MTLDEFLSEWNSASDTVGVHTSGSTGEPKPMLVEKRRMEASARITCRFLGLQQGENALLCLPVDYIAGKMMVVRALTCGLRLIAVPPSGHPLSAVADSLTIGLAAMVPMQVYNTLQVPEERQRLMRIRHLIIGGGAVDPSMAAELKGFPNAVWSTYGMTETLSHIALRRLSGSEATAWYTPFEGVSVRTDEEQCLVIEAPAVHDGLLHTNDIAELHTEGNTTTFRILGRKDNVICSGGVKIQTEQAEELLRPYLPSAFLISRKTDARLGQAVVLLTEGDTQEAQAICRQVLPRYWQPRAYLHVDCLPMTATGKPARKEAEHLAAFAVEV